MTGRPRGARDRGRTGERGSTALEFAVLSVAFLLLVFLVVQAALYYHARNVVKAEAEGVARAVRAYPTTATGPLRDQVPPPGQVQSLAETEAVRQWQLLDNGGDTTSAPEVTAEVVDYDQVRVTISAKPIMIVPGLFGTDLEITATAGGPFEVFKRSGDD
ncbi:MAG TPA: TadE/TadG family type IV pilus assembly protein [Mycobacteriales bacterium]|nr:TadE/TadG family type IV pilus assembly protein [Mycobacteriales bacterium]